MEEFIKQILAEKFNAKKDSIDYETPLSLIVDDSLGKIELFFEMEEALNIRISYNDVLDIQTFGDLVDIFQSLKERI